ncbi:hypothetical protein [Corynebacterium rouxii]|uniref:Uncharacterized protein n=1 Tax=Corynebacterium rouxii TaxID=2719119 RepID=A0ABU3PJY8_9CORY|nr:hypothetical protein [Corynebacterium rouxii]MDT9407959.1 hypothetical protein [Corynebacterium rouxii]MDT9410141.1 hypothetical protein [Corynebacterium rouxii]
MGVLWCEIGPDLPACIRLLELKNTKNQARENLAQILSCGFCVREFEEAKNMCGKCAQKTEQPQRTQTPENKNNRRSQ